MFFIPAARDLDNGSWGYDWALESIGSIDQGCHAPYTPQFSWNKQDQPIVGMIKLL